MFIDDDRDYILNPETTFLGYKCPHGQCDVIKEEHDYCLAVRLRLDAIAKSKYNDPEWFETFKFNWNAWLIKTQNKILSRAS